VVFVSGKQMTAALEQTIRDIMTPNVVRVKVFDDQEIVAKVVATKYNIVVLPVVDNEEWLVGGSRLKTWWICLKKKSPGHPVSEGQNAGSQTVATVIRALVLREIEFGEVFHVALREATAASTIGVILGGIAFVRVLLGHTGDEMTWGVALALPFITV